MIPKIIHLICLGTKNKKLRNRINRIHRKLPDFEIKIWDENNFDLKKYKYTALALEKKSYAFASDYIRLYALYKFGGTYLDTDINIIRDISIDFSDSDQIVVGFEKKCDISSAIISSVPHSQIIGDMLHYMDDLANNSPETIGKLANVKWMRNFYIKYGVQLNGKKQYSNFGVKVLPECFYGYPSSESRIIHIMEASWQKSRPLSQRVGTVLRRGIKTRNEAIFYEKMRTLLWKARTQ